MTDYTELKKEEKEGVHMGKIISFGIKANLLSLQVFI